MSFIELLDLFSFRRVFHFSTHSHVADFPPRIKSTISLKKIPVNLITIYIDARDAASLGGGANEARRNVCASVESTNSSSGSAAGGANSK